MNAKTFHGAGMVVPVDENDVGYREVPETIGKKIFLCGVYIDFISWIGLFA